MSVIDRLVRFSLPLIPEGVMWSVARRYVAGSTLADAIERIRALRAEGFGTILDVLGEHVEDVAQAERAAREYHRALEALEGVDDRCPVSVKPTHLGLLLDAGICLRLLDELCTAAAASGRRVRVEMEESPTVDATLDVFGRLRTRHANLGCVLQARLFRTADDAARLLRDGPDLDVRLVKGIYLEPASIAWTRHEDIARSYEHLAETLVAGGAFVGFATHDDPLADACAGIVARHGLDQAEAHQRRYEFQLLMGVKLPTAQRLRDAGHAVRIYVPYGEDWRAYSLRRLAKNPELARHVLKAMFRRS